MRATYARAVLFQRQAREICYRIRRACGALERPGFPSFLDEVTTNMVIARYSARLRPMKMALIVASLAGASLALGAGCGGGGSSGDGGKGGGGGEGGGAADACFDYTSFKGDSPTVTFSTEVLPIFRNSCGLSSSCHGTNPPPGQPYLGPNNDAPTPTMEEMQTLVNALDAPSTKEPTMNLVSPGAPQSSFIMYKLDGVDCSRLKCAKAEDCGDLMPVGSTKPIDQTKRDIIRRWIAQGAKVN
jgi:hypothetical protein